MRGNKLPLEQRFWAKVAVKEPRECWPWTGSMHAQGYGKLGAGKRGKSFLAHRFAYELTNGPIPDGLHIDHTCHNGTDCPGGKTCQHRKCCNPSHLEAVEPVENVSRSHNANEHKTHCPKGHEYTPENTYRQPSKPNARRCRRCAAILDAQPHRTRAGRRETKRKRQEHGR
ncbi:HNH endonuclease [Arthrobacter phage Colucci]|uniref:HNH endonuclease n=1 Tax=Arthrobacter phage Colucci TaxID=2015834 RepID=A0A286N315_9CAUD|nr:HNH endonuclease [Arthrobacter phage Colucci]ASX98772.1 HNH endonuclease [Arthrobacter phage Colucci]